jgi:hypothetical protein
MIINDLPCLMVISEDDEVIGGKKIRFYNFNFKKLCGKKSVASAYTYADGKNVWASYGTSISLDGGVSETHSFAQSFSQS